MHHLTLSPNSILNKLFAVLVLSVLLGCNSKDTKEMHQQVNALTKSVTDLVGDSATTQSALEELRKLQQYEYKVISIPLDSSTANIESTLNKHGKERWECFSQDRHTDIESSGRDELRFFCRRRPETPLRFIPRAGSLL